jgi:hypothetical protein
MPGLIIGKAFAWPGFRRLSTRFQTATASFPEQRDQAPHFLIFLRSKTGLKSADLVKVHWSLTGARSSSPKPPRGSLYRTARNGKQHRPGVTQIPLQLLPRLCPFCRQGKIIGHGQRLKQAHDPQREQIWIRRGHCRPRPKTFTVLPDWSPPSGHYSLHCREQAWELLRQANANWERSVPHVAECAHCTGKSSRRSVRRVTSKQNVCHEIVGKTGDACVDKRRHCTASGGGICHGIVGFSENAAAWLYFGA